jgi:ParB family chromosome partitioning protein
MRAGGRVANADVIASAMGQDMRLWWSPDAAFLTRLSKADIAGVMHVAGCPKDAARAVGRALKICMRGLDERTGSLF